MSVRHVTHPNATKELIAAEIERIFAAVGSEPVVTLGELLADRAKRQRTR
jgi:hypothetical protein